MKTETTVTVEQIMNTLKERYGIESRTELESVMDAWTGLDISLFVSPTKEVKKNV